MCLTKATPRYKKNVDAAFGDKALKKASIYFIMKKVKAGKNTEDLRHQNAKKTKRTANIVAANIKEDRRLSVKELASSHGVSYGMMNKILYDDLGLVKKSTCWVPKLLSDDQRKERVQTCTEFVAAVNRRSMAMLDRIVTMDETMVSYHTPETKRPPNSG